MTAGQDRQGLVERSGFSIRYRIRGKGGAGTILCVHGFKDNGRSFDALADRLADRFTLALFDWPGHGESAAVGERPIGRAALLALLDAVVTELMPPRFLLLGHSMGAGLCLDYAGLFPARCAGLVVLEAALPADEPEPRIAAMRAWLRRMRKSDGHPVRPQMDAAAAKRTLRFVNQHLDEAGLALLCDGMTVATGPATVTWRHDPALDTVLAPDFLPTSMRLALWRQIECDVLACYGAHSPHWQGHCVTPGIVDRPDALPAPIADVLRAVPTSAPTVIAGSGHNLHRDAPDAIAALIANRFLPVLDKV